MTSLLLLLAHRFLPHTVHIPIELGPTRNSAVRSEDPENPTLVPSTEMAARLEFEQTGNSAIRFTDI